IPLRARTYIGSSVTSAPSSNTRPVSGEVRPTTIENVVVFPAPFGPSRPTTSPELMSRFTPLTTVRPLYDFVRSVVCSVATLARPRRTRYFFAFGADEVSSCHLHGIDRPPEIQYGADGFLALGRRILQR